MNTKQGPKDNMLKYMKSNGNKKNKQKNKCNKLWTKKKKDYFNKATIRNGLPHVGVVLSSC